MLPNVSKWLAKRRRRQEKRAQRPAKPRRPERRSYPNRLPPQPQEV